MYWNPCGQFFPVYLGDPWPLWIIIPLQIAYFYLIVRLMLQVLRVESLVPGWKLFWLAIIYGFPAVGPLAWWFSNNRLRRRRK